MSLKQKFAQKAIQFTLKYSSKIHGGQQIAPILKSMGVEHVFTLCGGHIAPIYLACEDEDMQVIDTRHEQAAVRAADGYARLTRNIGVAIVTAGPGVTDAITGITNAYFANSPVVIFAGLAPFDEWDRGSLQEMHQLDLVKPVTKWARTVTDPARIAEYTQSAIRQALTPPMGPTYLEIPIDILMEMISPGDVKSYSPFFAETAPEPANDALESLKSMLRQAKKPVMLAGSNIWWDGAEEALKEFATHTNLPTFLNGMARGTLPADHPAFFQYTRKHAFENADLIIIAGTPLDFRLKFGKFNNDAPLVMLDNDGSHIGNNRKVDLGVIGDLEKAFTYLSENINVDFSGWAGEIRPKEEEKQATFRSKGKSANTPITHHRFCAELAEFIDEDPIIIGDGGDIVAVGSKMIPLSHAGQWMDPGPFGCLGVGPSFAIAAHLVYPDKRVIILHGDGAFGLNGFEFDTAVRFGLPIVSVIGNDAGWGQIRNPQVAIMGENKSTGTDLAPTRYDQFVESLGGHGEFVESPDEIAPAIRRALDSGKPACVNVMLDPDTLKGGVNVMRGLSI
ncbi:MAG: acetolactate synthase [Candidatus Marinimicrobia bacterium]|nr:acetolactate synthase [Candidatus Neomarinimicrobiota bacterium]MCF7828531.1 acetolactate synthase [Candidatus Neomarinimicrobiota bacterium]MCF7882046.1 acetolactate synthase [Candidatus Neomarinimicrobiota bacterium]